VEIRYMLPLAEIIFDFFDQSSRGPRLRLAGLRADGEQQADLVKSTSAAGSR